MKILTVILTDYSPLHHAQEPAKHRTVHIALTEDQLIDLNPKQTHTIDGKPIYEEISQCFIEEIFK